MKVFTATFVSENYGTLLQAYALQCKLQELGATPVLVGSPNQNHDANRISLIQRLKTFLRPEKHYGIIYKTRRVLERRIFKEKKRKANLFISNNLSMNSYDNCRVQMEKEKCILLAGSDQVWNTLNKPINGFYLFDYVKTKNCKRCSYAASIGLSELNEEQKQYYATVLQDFYSVSFREKVAYDLLKDHLNNPIVRYDIDPTLLYGKKFWLGLAGERVARKPYVFVYMLRPDKRLIKMARIIEKKLHYKIVFLGQYNDIYLGCKTLFSAGVEDFLSAIANAEMIITNSFHCTVFSILFEKKFVSVKIESTSSRVENLLALLGLQDHLIDDIDSLDKIYKEYDTSQVEKILKEERNKSTDYLRELIDTYTD